MTRVVFMGSPGFAVPSLRALAASHAVVGVVTQPDRRAGRGRKLRPAAARVAAEQLGLPVLAPRRLSEPEVVAQLRDWRPDVIVVAAFGQILKPEVLQLPPHGCLNVHASLLPRHRGAAPVAAAMLAGDAETGVTIMSMDAGVDTGPIIAQRAVPIRPEHTGGSLAGELAELGAALLVETLPGFLSGALPPTPQDDSLATYAPQLRKEDGRLDWREPAEALARRVRALQPWPGTFAVRNGQPLKVLAAQARAGRATPGHVLQEGRSIRVGTGHGLLQLDLIQPPGKKPMPAADYARGAPGFVGSMLE